MQHPREDANPSSWRTYGLHNVTDIGKAFRTVNCLIVVAFAIAAPCVHRRDVHVDQNTANHVCQSYNVPVDCWKHGGTFRAMQFTAPTTTLSFTMPLPATESAPTAYMVQPEPWLVAHQETAQACAAVWPSNHSHHKRAACELERVPLIWENPNAHRYRELYTLAGGVHIWYFMWISLWLGASFCVSFLPARISSVRVDSGKLGLLMVWHVMGVLLSVCFYLDDSYFNMRLPLSNVAFGVVLELAAVLLQLLWARVSQEHSMDAVSLSAGYQHVPRLLGMLTLAPAPAAPMRLGDEYSLEIFSAKYMSNSLLETFFMEAAITLPPVMVAVFCMCSRVNMDWVVQSLYVRALFAFVCIALAYRAVPVLQREHGKNAINAYELGIVLIALVVTTSAFVTVLIADWYTPVHETVVFWGDAYNPGAKTLALTSLALLVIVLVFYIFTLVVITFTASFTELKTLKDRFSENIQLYAWYFAQLVMLVFRVLVFLYAVDPRLWYEAYDKRDVMMHYPSLTYAD